MTEMQENHLKFAFDPACTGHGTGRFARRNRSGFLSFPAAMFFVAALSLAAAAAHAAATPPATIDSFVAASFAQAPAAATLWLTPELKAAAKKSAGFAPDGARIRYWKSGDRTAWVIDRIGKEAPITFGIVIENDAVVGLRVLTYRESRGFEIQSPKWLAQFNGIRSASDGKHLDRTIDNISGATLSVRAGRDVARLALFLHAQQVEK